MYPTTKHTNLRQCVHPILTIALKARRCKPRRPCRAEAMSLNLKWVLFGVRWMQGLLSLRHRWFMRVPSRPTTLWFLFRHIHALVLTLRSVGSITSWCDYRDCLTVDTATYGGFCGLSMYLETSTSPLVPFAFLYDGWQHTCIQVSDIIFFVVVAFEVSLKYALQLHCMHVVCMSVDACMIVGILCNIYHALFSSPEFRPSGSDYRETWRVWCVSIHRPYVPERHTHWSADDLDETRNDHNQRFDLDLHFLIVHVQPSWSV